MIESTYGLGELLVSGSVTPDRFTVSHRTREITTHLSKNKYYGLFFEPDLSIGENFKVAAHQARMVSHAGELILASFPYTMRISSTLTTAQIHELYACALSLADFFGKPQDVEWCYVNNKLTLLQSRPITIAVPTMVQSSTLGTLSGTCVSKGSAIGRAFHITDTSNFTLPTEEFILVAHETKPDMIYQMSRASGIVTEVGGMLCHAAIVARELGIPCLVGVDDALSLLREGSLIQLNEEGVRLL
jgi:pyruvate,water dikinase